jgi:hypothetical protein
MEDYASWPSARVRRSEQMAKHRAKSKTNFAELAVRQALELEKFPERIIDIATRNIPPHTSPEFDGLDLELGVARSRAERLLKQEEDDAERDMRDAWNEISRAERRLSEVQECRESREVIG